MKKLFLTYLILQVTIFSYANKDRGIDPLKKQAKASRVEANIKIDGNLDETAWRHASSASEFIQNEPNPGFAASQKTEVKVLYDNTALYIQAIMYDTSPDSIFNQLTERDEIGNADWFGIIIDAYQDGTNGVGFFVTPSGGQLDIKYFPQRNNRGRGGVLFSGDRNWDAVWESAAKITEYGWVAEIMIPYSAIRFPAQDEQVWNVNFGRLIRRNREQTYWNHIDPAQNGFLQQSGQISGISEIKSPVRLSATPFLSVYGELHRDKYSDPVNSWGRSFNGGMDIKYGINDAFTLDMTLVPDFGQVQFDNQVLNLSPFEVRFDENRQFFTEGVELFNKGNLFYSRRVGGRPLGYYDVEDQLLEGEEITANPGESQLLNASKISGRTNGGLGIGVFNAISKKTYATIENIENGTKREVLTNPLTNYSVVTLDQNLKNNSYITLVNTNVTRGGSFYDANTTGTVFDFKNKAQSYSLSGKGVVSQKYFEDDPNDIGHAASIRFRKTAGNFQYSIGYSEESDTYDINDLGFIFNNNERSVSGNISYNIFKPFAFLRRFSTTLWSKYERLYAPSEFSEFGIFLRIFGVSMDNYGMGVNFYTEPIETFDFFEPRTDDFSRYYRMPQSFSVDAFVSSNYNKTFFFDASIDYRKLAEDGRYQLELGFEPNVRISDKWTVGLETSVSNNQNDVGYVTKLENDTEDIIFGRRDNVEFENLVKMTYTFNNKMSFTFRLRHYWAKAEYSSLHRLDDFGRLADTDYDDYHDNSFNSFTIDAVYRWRFAPGSDIFIVWKNNTTQFNNDFGEVRYNYMDSVSQLGDIPSVNSLSVRVIYFLDYLSLRRKG